MYFPSSERSFGITHPLGFPRPIDPENFFGAKALFFARNLMPVPMGCVAHFDVMVYRPYLRRLVAYLMTMELGWEAPAFLDNPPRYCVVRDGVAATIPPELRPMMPPPPRVPFRDVLTHFGAPEARTQPMQLLDLLTLVSEDLGSDKFTSATKSHPWVAELMR